MISTARKNEIRINIGIYPKLHKKAKIIKEATGISINEQVNLGLYLLYAYLTKVKAQGKDPWVVLNHLKGKMWRYVGKFDEVRKDG